MKLIEYGNPVSSGCFHADFVARISCKPVNQLFQSSGKRGKTALLVLGSPVFVDDADTGINPCFVNVQTASILAVDFEHKVPLQTNLKVRQELVIRQNRVDF